MCRHCGGWYCNECLVFSFGPNKPPYCIACALAAAGVRSNAARKSGLSRREMKRREKQAAKAMQDLEAKRESEISSSMAIDWAVGDDVAS